VFLSNISKGFLSENGFKLDRSEGQEQFEAFIKYFFKSELMSKIHLNYEKPKLYLVVVLLVIS
jgi:hypothetical protein